MTGNLLDPHHYMKLPICGYCMNAWDQIYNRSPWDQRPGSIPPSRWLELCRVGGCDPDAWDFLDEETGLPHPDPTPDDRLFHRRGQGRRWERYTPKLVSEWAAIRNAKYQKVTDQHGNVLSKVVADDRIAWDEEEPVAVSDDDIEW